MDESTVTRESIIEAARAVAKNCEATLSKTDFIRLTGIGEHHIWRLFPEGGWTKIRELAGIERHPRDHDALSDDQLLAEYLRVAKEVGRIPTWSIFESRANVSRSVITRRFGGLSGTLKRLRDFLETHDPLSPLLVELQAKFKHEIPTPPAASTAQALSKNVWAKGSGPVFGQPIDFRGLRHAPINEQGVVFPFGMVAYELGFIVESVQAGYPDCEAKRCVDRKTQRWQRVRIEFEFHSSNFAQHGHEQAGCDVVVCWEHDWPECPLEVVELRSLISSLDA
jgi:hypothetical protein